MLQCQVQKDDFKVLGQSNLMCYVEISVPYNGLEPTRHTKMRQIRAVILIDFFV